jgi:hypothetical protein
MKLTPRLKKILLALIVIGAITGSWVTWYVFFKPHRDVSAETANYTITAQALTEAFANAQQESVTMYIDKAILIDGVITEVGPNSISMGNVICNFDDDRSGEISKVAVGESVKIQGRVSTYNDLMEEIVVDKCAIK